MKKIIAMMMLLTGISQQSIAQQNRAASNADEVFSMPAGTRNRSFTADLGKSNKMQVEISDLDGLNLIGDIDSLLAVFLKDIVLIKDSLADEFAARRIDYITDETGRKKFRLLQYPPKGTSFVVQEGYLSALKLEQDTVNFFGRYSYRPTGTLIRQAETTGAYRLSFYVNHLSDLQDLKAAGLNDKMATIKAQANKWWVKGADGKWRTKDGDPSITANHQPAGYVSGSTDYLESRLAVNMQNYKDRFVPSFGLGLALGFRIGKFTHEFGLEWEPHFNFEKNGTGKLQTFRNDFLTFSYNRDKTNATGMPKVIVFNTDFSLGYLIRRKGDLFEPQSLRLGVGNISLKHKISLEPGLYFHDLFKDVTPTLKLQVSF